MSRRSRVRDKTVGELPRAAGKQRRVPFAKTLPRGLKREAGRTEAARVPANIRVAGVQLNQDDRAYIRQLLGLKLGKYADSIERVTVRVKDVNGPRGGIDQVCRIKIVLAGLPSVLFESRAVSVEAAINDALTGVERAVRRSVQRRRVKPIRRRSDEAPFSEA
jgi:ribosome-associated translation inhibitor RaiA